MNVRTWGTACALVAACALSACAHKANLPDDSKSAPGKLFSPGAFATLTLGYSGREAALAATGVTPYRSDITILRKDDGQNDLPAPVVIQRQFFAYAGEPSEGTGVEARPHRDVMLTFADDKLLGMHRTSSFTVDSTAFRPALVAQLHKGRSTQTEVRQLMGPPSGQSIHPMAKAAGHTRWTYSELWWGGNGWYSQILRLDFDASGVLQDLNLDAGKH